MRNWRKIAEAEGFNIPDAALDQSVPVLDALERAFRPLPAAIPPEVEPAIIFHVDGEEDLA